MTYTARGHQNVSPQHPGVVHAPQLSAAPPPVSLNQESPAGQNTEDKQFEAPKQRETKQSVWWQNACIIILWKKHFYYPRKGDCKNLAILTHNMLTNVVDTSTLLTRRAQCQSPVTSLTFDPTI